MPERYIRTYGTERMAFGTDYPLWDPLTETERFRQLRLTDGEFDQIGHKRLLWKIICTRDIIKDNNTFKEAHYAA